MTAIPNQGAVERSPRVYYGGQIALKVRSRGSNETALVQNLSEGGVFLLSAQKYSPGTELMLYLPIELGSRRNLCMVSGKIIRIQAAQTVKHVQGYGVAFDRELPKSSRQLLHDYVEMKMTGKVPERPAKAPVRISRHRD